MAPDPVLPPLPANLDALQRADLVALCDESGLLVKRTETAAALRERLRRRHADAARHQRDLARNAAEAEYRKRVPAPERNPALDVMRAGLWGLANLASALEQDGQVAQTLYHALPALAGYVRGTGGFTREEVESALVAVEESLRWRKHADGDEVSSRIAHSLGEVARAHAHHDGIVEARRAARKAEVEARKATSAQ
jgi:hypothetical protein